MRSPLGRPSRPDLFCAAALFGLALALGHGAASGRVYFERDIYSVWYSQIEDFVRCIAAGAWPVWDPWIGFGQPMAANPSAQVFYPPTWLNLLMPAWAYYSAYVLAHLFTAGLGFFLLARRLKLERLSALTGAALWMSSGPLLSLVNVWHHFAGAAWMPWVLLALLVCLEDEDVGLAALAGVVLAIQIVAGSPDLCAMTLLLAAPLVIDRLRPPGRSRRLLRLAAFVTVAAGLGAAQWLTTLASALGSNRLALSPEKRVAWSLHPVSLLQTLLPVSFEGLPRDAAWSVAQFDLWSPFLASVYLGLPALTLALFAFARPRRDRNLFAFTGLAFLLFALGRHLPFHAAALLLLPPLQALRFPVKAMPAVALCVALLAAMGLEALREARRRSVAFAMPVAGVLAVAGILTLASGRGWLGGQWGSLGLTLVASSLVATLAWRLVGGSAAAVPILAALAVLDLVAAHWNLNRTTRREFFAEVPEAARLLTSGGPARIHVWDYVMPVPGLERRGPNRIPVLMEDPRGWPFKVGQAMALESYLYPPSAARFGLFGSYDPDLLDLSGPQSYAMNQLVRASATTPAYGRLMRLGAVDYVVALHDEGFPGLERMPDVKGLFSEPIRIFRVPDRLPRTYAVGVGRAVDGSESGRGLLDPAFDPGRDVLVAGVATPIQSPAFSARLRVLEERPDRIRVETDADNAGYLVRVDADGPGWRASVDGRPVPSLRANVLFRAVEIPAGHHVVEWAYRPLALTIGLTLSVVSLLAWVVLLFRRR